MTGDEYIESLRDGREIWIYGERVKDVTTHPAFRNTVRMIARLYDALHDPAEHGRADGRRPTPATAASPTRSSRRPHSSEDLVGGRDAIADWARMTYGWMGRSPDYKAAFLGTLGAQLRVLRAVPGQRQALVQGVAGARSLYWNHAIVNPPVDRNLPPDEVGDVYMHVEKETDAGLIVTGAKVVATGSALTHYNFIAHYGLPDQDEASTRSSAPCRWTPRA